MKLHLSSKLSLGFDKTTTMVVEDGIIMVRSQWPEVTSDRMNVHDKSATHDS